MHRAVLALLATLLIGAPRIQAQTTLPVDSRLRVTLQDGQQVIGRVAETRGDTVVVIKDGMLRQPRVRLHADQITRVDVSRGKYVSVGRVIGGGLVGALVGLVVVRLTPEPTTLRCDGDICRTDPKSNAAVLVGAAGGVLLGLVVPVDRWHPVAPPVRVGLGGDARQARLGFSFAF